VGAPMNVREEGRRVITRMRDMVMAAGTTKKAVMNLRHHGSARKKHALRNSSWIP